MILKLDSCDNYKVTFVDMYRPILNVTLFSMLVGIWRLSIALTLEGDMSMVKINEKLFVSVRILWLYETERKTKRALWKGY